MTENKSRNQRGSAADQQGLAENIGVSTEFEDFGGGRGQMAGTQESPASQDQFSEDVMEIYDEDDTAPKAHPQPPYDYFEKDDKS